MARVPKALGQRHHLVGQTVETAHPLVAQGMKARQEGGGGGFGPRRGREAIEDSALLRQMIEERRSLARIAVGRQVIAAQRP
jgi:hypothetical protein